jgi:hypothetical protein
MGLKSFGDMLFSSFSSMLSRAGESFKSVVSSVQQYTPFTPGMKHRREKEEKDQWNLVRKFNQHLNPSQYIPKENIVKTTANLKQKYQYIFEMDIHFETGLKRVDPTVSLLSSKRLTPAQARSQLIHQIMENENNYGDRIIEISNISFQAERQEYLI